MARFQHHGIDLGDGSAVHFTDGVLGIAGPGGNPADFEIKQTDLDIVTRNGKDKVHHVNYGQRLSEDETIERAFSKVGHRGYHLLFHNCEHFAAWCVVDRHESRQISVACNRLSSVGAKTIAATSVQIAARIGFKGIVRGASPWMLASDAAQWATEIGGHHVGLRDPVKRKRASRAVGMTTALTIGAFAGPIGLAVAGGLWCVGEAASEVSQTAYEKARKQNSEPKKKLSV